MIDVIEALVWTPSALPEPELRHAEQLVATDPVARDLWEFLSALRAEMLDHASEWNPEDMPTHVRTFAESLYTPPRRIPLRMKREVDRDVKTRTALRTNMAAATASRSTRFRSLGSMLNREEGILVRFLLDDEADLVRGYALSTSGVDVTTSVVVLEGHAQPICPDANGAFSFPASWVRPPSSLADQNVDLLLPVAALAFEGRPEDFTIHHPDSGEVMATFSVRGKDLIPAISTDGPYHLTATCSGGDATVLVDNEPVPCDPGVPCVIRAYAR
ncbi:MAG: hypothetical protein RIE53_13320 [Rhodothermales bacterium]